MRECFGTEEYNKKDRICKNCPFLIACKIAIRKKAKERRLKFRNYKVVRNP